MVRNGNIYRALVTNADPATGSITVTVPSIGGVGHHISITSIGRKEVNGNWKVPDVGAVVLVGSDDVNASNLFLIPTYSYDETLWVDELHANLQGTIVFIARNDSASTISATKLVCGRADGSDLVIGIASGNDVSKPAIGFALDDIPPNGYGRVAVAGVIYPIDTSTLSANIDIFCGINGGVVSTPIGLTYPQVVGKVLNVGTQGSVLITIENLSTEIVSSGSFSGVFAGTIYAAAGNIGGASSGWIIDSDRLESRGTTKKIVMDGTDGEIYIGTFGAGTYNGASTPFYVNQDGYFSLGNKLTFNPTTSVLDINGKITAASGNIGGWNIGVDRLNSGTGSSTVGLSTGGSVSIYAGGSNENTAPFRVTNTGYLTATGVDLNGRFVATSGSVGGWAIDSGKLWSTGATGTQIVLDSSNGKMYVGNENWANTGNRFYVDNAGKFSLGSKLTWDGSLLLIDGTITAASGTIGGWSIDNTKLYAGTGSNFIALSSDNAIEYRTWAGSPTPASAPFYITKTGGLLANNASITGRVVATSGSFSGSITAASISGSTITGGLISGTSVSGVSITGSTVTAGSISGNTITGGSISGALVTAGSISGNSITGGSISGSTISGNTISGGTISGVSLTAASISGGQISIGSNFNVSNTGVITASGASINGVINATSGTFSGTITAASISGSTITGNTISGGTISGSQVTGASLSGGQITIGSGFSVNNAGVLTASGASIQGNINATSGSFSGTISATSGSIGGWSLGANEIFRDTSGSASTYRTGLYASTGSSSNPSKFYMVKNDGIALSSPSHASSTTPFYVDSNGRFSIADKVFFDPSDSQSFGTLTVIGRIRGAIENTPIVPTDSGQFTVTAASISGTSPNQTAVITTTATHTFAVGDTVIIESLTTGASTCNGAWAIAEKTTTTFTITGVSGATTGNYTGQSGIARVRELTLGLHPAFNGSPAGLGIRLDEYNYWFVNNQYRVGSSGSFFKWDGATLEVSGKVSAQSGNFSGFMTINNGTMKIGANANGASHGFYIGTSGDYLYDSGAFRFGGASGIAYSGSGNVTVGTGVVVNGNISGATGTFSGSLNATSGSIGGWLIGGTSFTSGTGSSSVGVASSGGFPFYAGSTTASVAPFRVTSTGGLTATGASIVGTINATNSTFTGSVTAASISGSSISGTSITAGSISGNTITGGSISGTSITAGSVSGAYITGGSINGTSVTAASISGGQIAIGSNFNVTNAGVLTASGASINGAINASSGTFTGTITAASITGGSINGTSITAGSISGNTITGSSISGTTITAGSISGNTITGGSISGAVITAGSINGNTITGGVITGSSVYGVSVTGASVTGAYVSGGSVDIGTNPSVSFHIDNLGNVWTGASTGTVARDSAPFRLYNDGSIDIGGNDSTSLHINALGNVYAGAPKTDPSLAPSSISISSITGLSGSSITITTSAAHGFLVGHRVTGSLITSNPVNSLNFVDFTVTGASTTAFTVANPTSASVIGLLGSGSQVTYQTASAHNFRTGASVTVTGVTGGTGGPGYSGTFVIQSIGTTDTFVVNNTTTGAPTLSSARAVMSTTYTSSTGLVRRIPPLHINASDGAVRASFVVASDKVSGSSNHLNLNNVLRLTSDITMGNQTLYATDSLSSYDEGFNFSLSAANGFNARVATTPAIQINSSGYTSILPISTSSSSVTFSGIPTITVTSGHQAVYRNNTNNALAVLTSQRALKENIVDISDSGSLIDLLRPVNFVARATGEETPEQTADRVADIQFGFIAEEVDDASGGRLSSYSIHNGEKIPVVWRMPDMIALAIAEIKDLRQRVASLEAQ